MKSFINYVNPFIYERIGRARYACIYILYLIFFLGSMFLIVHALKETLGDLLFVPLSVWLIFAATFKINLRIKRMRDMNCSGWWVLTLIIPYISVIPELIMFSVSGTNGPNRFGEKPPKASKIEKWVYIATVVLLLSLLAWFIYFTISIMHLTRP